MITINYYTTGLSAQQYESILSLLNKTKMDVQEAVSKVEAQTVQLNKIFGEVNAIKQALADAIAAGKTVPQELADAIDAAGAATQAIDDLNPDA